MKSSNYEREMEEKELHFKSESSIYDHFLLTSFDKHF